MATEQIGQRAFVSVGEPVEITQAEGRLLHELAINMRTASNYRVKGWLLEYLRAHKHAHEILQRIMRRSHAN
jgi:hypothetical protein